MNDTRRKIPSVSSLVLAAENKGLIDSYPRTVVTNAIRAVLVRARAAGGKEPEEGWLAAVESETATWRALSLKRVINATGVVLHTNLGRAPLADAAKDAVWKTLEYSTLEYNESSGTRGSRQKHVRAILKELTGAEDALVVNNAAAALLLTINTLAGGGETVISRGELVEIGGSFRLPDIIAKSDSHLVEVGTTNRTHLPDYENAVTASTKCLLKVHRSNFTIDGFVSEVSIEDLVRLGLRSDIAVVHDVGSGLLIDLAEFGLTGEPLVRNSVTAGATAIFSGDKLLGGPQAGIIVGSSEIIEQLSKNPLARVVRADKTAIAGLEATLAIFRDRDTALTEIPTLRMLTVDGATLKKRARRLSRRIPGSELIRGHSSVGGGAFPNARLETTLVSLATDSCEAVLEKLRSHSPPIIARCASDAVLLDVRTVTDQEFGIIADAFAG
ncbi:MAG: L-seryl-tRNA(Sec) selenium transferase [Gemmatimonadetes bacterium]|nr:L-seryl-tRNA(Sec) selenium transferase [Gemmatimonadota bacterium]